MRTASFVVFFGIFLALYGLVNLYIFIRGLEALPQGSTLRSAYAIVFWVAALSFIGGRFLERAWTSALSDLLVWTGSFWIAAMLYFLLAAVIVDLLRLVNFIVPYYPPFITDDYARAKYVITACSVGVVAVLLLAGHINALIPRVRTLDLTVDKKTAGMKTVNIVAASDIHLGTIVGRHRFDHIVDGINKLNPDVVLLPGDIVDEDLAPVIKQNLGDSLRSIKSRFGVYAITGNHEYIGGVEEACAYLQEHSVVMLRDQSVKVNDSFFLIGREDRSCTQFTGKRRKALEELLTGVDKAYPLVLMDHQPFQLNEAAGLGIDLQLSGHTHHGQLWPVNFIIKAIYEVGWGYKKVAGTHVYVSNGVGTWGPPVRLGHRPEIVNIRLNFR